MLRRWQGWILWLILWDCRAPTWVHGNYSRFHLWPPSPSSQTLLFLSPFLRQTKGRSTLKVKVGVKWKVVTWNYLKEKCTVLNGVQKSVSAHPLQPIQTELSNLFFSNLFVTFIDLITVQRLKWKKKKKKSTTLVLSAAFQELNFRLMQNSNSSEVANFSIFIFWYNRIWITFVIIDFYH